MKKTGKKRPKLPSLIGLLKPYKKLIVLLISSALLANGLTLWLPRLLSRGIDSFLSGDNLNSILWEFAIMSVIIFLLTFIQSIVRTYASEKVARDLRSDLSAKISTQSYAEVQKVTPSKLLTNLTSDIDSIKTFVSQAVVNVVSSSFLIIGGSYMLLSTNWKLGLSVLAILPVIGLTFYFILRKIRPLFLKTREVIDWLNKVINESILGSAIVRVLNSQNQECKKFSAANGEARYIGLSILKLFSVMMPTVFFISNFAVLIILVLGGHFVIMDTMTLGEFAAFNSYLMIIVFPIMILGFISNFIVQAQVSYVRILAVLRAPSLRDNGTIVTTLQGDIQLENLNLSFGEKCVLKNISMSLKPGTRVAIIGPTAAGKTQLLNLLIGLIQPTKGVVKYDDKNLNNYRRENFYSQVGLVFQDSVIFNTSLRENIAFNSEVKEANLRKAIETAELVDFIGDLPEGLETIVSERGTSLSGGQKQRIMLARALAINPRILLLDDFTARVDSKTEEKILANVAKNYPKITLISVTQKISAVEQYDQIVLLMKGEVVARGMHQELMRTSPEYVQIFNSQQSMNTYELQSK